MSTAFVTMADSKFLIGCDVLVHSIIKNSPGFFEKCDDKVLLALDENIKSFRDFKIVYVNPEEYPYCRIGRAEVSPSKLHMFSLHQYDRIIFYEADTVCVGDINQLHSAKFNKYDFAACRIYYKTSKAERVYNGKPLFLGDGWVVNINLLKGKFYRTMARTFAEKKIVRGEQDIITAVLDDYGFNTLDLDPTFDVVQLMEHSPEEPYASYFKNARMYHITSPNKPWIFIGNENCRKSIMATKWLELYHEMMAERK